MNKEIMEVIGFGEVVKSVEDGECPFCHIKVSILDFRDELSRKEFSISGLCQKCQDNVFREVE